MFYSLPWQSICAFYPFYTARQSGYTAGVLFSSESFKEELTFYFFLNYSYSVSLKIYICMYPYVTGNNFICMAF